MELSCVSARVSTAPTVALRVGRVLVMLTVAFGACTSRDDVRAVKADPTLTSTSMLSPMVGAGVVDPEFDAYALAVSGPRIVMIAGQEPLIVFINTLTGTVDSLSREGAGPGEFRSPVSAWFTPEGVSIYDRALARITRFTDRGTVQGADQVVGSGSEALGYPGRPTLFATQGASHFGYFLRGDGSLRLFGERTQDRLPMTRDLLAVGGGGRYFVYEAASGLLMTLDSLGGALFPPKRIPGWLFDALSEQYATMSANSKLAPRVSGSAPAAKFLLGLPSGEALLFYAVGGHRDLGFAIRFDPETSEFRKLAYPADSVAADLLFRAGTGATDGRLLIVSALRGTAMFKLSD